MKISDKELSRVIGGTISATMFNAFARILNTIYEIGYGVGSAARRFFEKKSCSLE